MRAEKYPVPPRQMCNVGDHRSYHTILERSYGDTGCACSLGKRVVRVRLPLGAYIDTLEVYRISTKRYERFRTGSIPVKGIFASIAQLDRAPDFGSGGCWFKSCLGHMTGIVYM